MVNNEGALTVFVKGQKESNTEELPKMKARSRYNDGIDGKEGRSLGGGTQRGRLGRREK